MSLERKQMAVHFIFLAFLSCKLFETDDEVVESVKTSESELQLGLESIGTESEVSQPNKTGYYEEYRRYLKLLITMSC